MSVQPNPQQLRRSAEEKLASLPPASTTRSAGELIHELQVQQIELEMQNENLRQMQFELERSRERYMDFYDFAPVGYLTLKENGQITAINLTGAAKLGVDRSKLLYQRLSSYIAAEYRERWQKYFTGVLKGEALLHCELAFEKSGGSRFFARLDCMRQVKTDEIPEVRIVLTDITERIKYEEEIRKLAFYDVLTELPNRRLLGDRLDHAMAASKRSGRYGALMFADLDNFKPLNDKHGHNMGDLLLIEVARRITGCLREMDTVARFGGDEFVVLLGELDASRHESMLQAGVVAEKIRAALAETYRLIMPEVGILQHHCTSSIGVTLFSNHEESATEILKHADMAMYQAKAAGRNIVRFFQPEI